MSSTPITSEAEVRNYVHAHRPFKNPASSKGTNRRVRTLKQILAAERDAALGIVNAPSDHKKGAKGRRMLTGAAAAAAKRREEQAAVAAAAASSAADSGAATPAEVDGDLSTAALTEQDGDTTMASVQTTGGTQTPAIQETQDAAESASRKRRGLSTYSTVEAPPSLRPQKKFCDITGLVAPYTDPKSGLRYHSVEIYEIIKTFVSDQVADISDDAER